MISTKKKKICFVAWQIFLHDRGFAELVRMLMPRHTYCTESAAGTALSLLRTSISTSSKIRRTCVGEEGTVLSRMFLSTPVNVYDLVAGVREQASASRLKPRPGPKLPREGGEA